MRGFLWGTVGLSILYVVLQDGAADRLASGSGVLAAGFRRLVSPTVAGIPDRAGGQASAGSSAGQSGTTPSTPSGPSSGGGTLV